MLPKLVCNLYIFAYILLTFAYALPNLACNLNIFAYTLTSLAYILLTCILIFAYVLTFFAYILTFLLTFWLSYPAYQNHSVTDVTKWKNSSVPFNDVSSDQMILIHCVAYIFTIFAYISSILCFYHAYFSLQFVFLLTIWLLLITFWLLLLTFLISGVSKRLTQWRH